ncbi:hypothetical protein EF905_31970, partial [Streptomyces sp. WAC05374]
MSQRSTRSPVRSSPVRRALAAAVVATATLLGAGVLPTPTAQAAPTAAHAVHGDRGAGAPTAPAADGAAWAVG